MAKVEPECPISYWSKTPSRADGISAETELTLRQKVCRFVLTITRMMDIKDAFAEIQAFELVQSFYNCQSFKSCPIDKYDLGLAALFISLKLNDRIRSLNELVLNQWRYLSPKAPVPDHVTQNFQKRVQCICKAELLLIKTINFKLHFNHLFSYSNKIFEIFFPCVLKKSTVESKKLWRHFYHLTHHSFWTHVNSFYDPYTVGVACLKLATEEVNAPDLRFDFSLNEVLCVDMEDVKDIITVLTFGNFHIPGEYSSHDVVQRVNYKKFKSHVASKQVQEHNQSPVRDFSVDENFIILIKNIPPAYKHQASLQKFFKNEEITFTKFILSKHGNVNVFVYFRHKQSIIELFKSKIFSHQHHKCFKVNFPSQVCDGKMDTKERIGIRDVRIDESASIFVSNLCAKTSEEDLVASFSSFGDIVSVKIPSKRFGSVSPTYGFVNFKEKGSKDRALESKVKVNGVAVDLFTRSIEDKQRDLHLNCGVSVEGLKEKVVQRLDEFQLVERFETFGPISSVCLFKDSYNALGLRNIAFVFFCQMESRKKALKWGEQHKIRFHHNVARVKSVRYDIDLLCKFSLMFPVRVFDLPVSGSSLELDQALSICGDFVASKLRQKVPVGSLEPLVEGYALFSSKESQKLAVEMKNLRVRGERLRVFLAGERSGKEKPSVEKKVVERQPSSDVIESAPLIKRVFVILCEEGARSDEFDKSFLSDSIIFKKEVPCGDILPSRYYLFIEASFNTEEEIKTAEKKLNETDFVQTVSVRNVPKNFESMKALGRVNINFSTRSINKQSFQQKITALDLNLKPTFIGVLAWVSCASLYEAELAFKALKNDRDIKKLDPHFSVKTASLSRNKDVLCIKNFECDEEALAELCRRFDCYGKILKRRLHKANHLATFQFEDSQQAFSALDYLSRDLLFFARFGELDMSLRHRLYEKRPSAEKRTNDVKKLKIDISRPNLAIFDKNGSK